MFTQELRPAVEPLALLQSLSRAPGLAWLDSDGSRSADGRFSFLTAWPVTVRRSDGPDSLAMLDALGPRAADVGGCAEWAPGAVPHWIGYLAYDLPGVCFARYEALFAFDHWRQRAFVLGDDEGACARLLARAGVQPGAPQPPPAAELAARAGPVHVADPAQHAAAIASALERIGRGELYQVNLARRSWASLEGPPLALALAMRRESPVPLGLYFDDGKRAVIGRSMERFLRWNAADRALHTRPIKGTVARGSAVGEHAEQRALREDPKEHAEHAMIIDLMRNDLGRVAAIGSVRVVERFAVESFARLHHLVSTVACTTRPDVHASDVLRATFPPGSVTGTPKLRAIETIAELEPVGRGIYTGAFGFVDRAGGLSLAVAIRTAVVEAGTATYYAGGGIVEASQIEREIAETELKARVFVDAIARLGRVDSNHRSRNQNPKSCR